MSIALYTSGEEAITRTLDIEAEGIKDEIKSLEHFQEYYEIDRTADEIIRGSYKRIALQFPDELLHASVPIYRLLKSKIQSDQDLYILADTSYGSCCVDEVAAQHVDADAVVHYGHACMSQTYRLPVVYVFGKKSIDVDDCTSRLIDLLSSTEISSKSVLFRHDVAYTYYADQIVNKLRESLEPLGLSISYQSIKTKSEPPQKTQSVTTEATPTEDTAIAYVGAESLGLTNLLVTHGSSEVFSYNPRARQARLESARTNKLLMRRYAVVQKARDADVFGILVGTLGVASYLPLISHIRTLLKRGRKKSYTISVGKLNPAKLANFMEIECFVLVACPENSLIDAKDFYRPIVTPYELEVALQAEQSWTGKYVLDFEQLLSEHDEKTNEGHISEEDPDQPVFSLVTGTYRHAKRYGGEQPSDDREDTTSSAVALRNQDGTVARLADSAAGQYLQSRTYQGLDTRIGEDAPSVLEQGRSGVARGYGENS